MRKRFTHSFQGLISVKTARIQSCAVAECVRETLVKSQIIFSEPTYTFVIVFKIVPGPCSTAISIATFAPSFMPFSASIPFNYRIAAAGFLYLIASFYLYQLRPSVARQALRLIWE
jgi:hypothetical protein